MGRVFVFCPLSITFLTRSRGSLCAGNGHGWRAIVLRFLRRQLNPFGPKRASQPCHSPETGGKRFCPACQQATGRHRTGALPPVRRISACCTTESARGLAQSKTSRASGGTCSSSRRRLGLRQSSGAFGEGSQEIEMGPRPLIAPRGGAKESNAMGKSRRVVPTLACDCTIPCHCLSLRPLRSLRYFSLP